MKKNVIPQPATPRELLNALLLGVPPEKLRPALSKLEPAELQKVLCTACSMRQELIASCSRTAANIERLLRHSCTVYRSEAEQCRICRFFRLNIESDAQS